jgi:hypothetical protein
MPGDWADTLFGDEPQEEVFDHDTEPPDFDGWTYQHDRDYQRLKRLLDRVQYRMADGNWWSLWELAERTGGSEASVSARLRDLRKPKFGGHTVERRYVGPGLFEYKLTLREEQES